MTFDTQVLADKVKYYYCPICGNIFEIVNSSGNRPICCGKSMQLLIPSMNDGAAEKHLPAFKIEANRVEIKVGSDPHPMTADHYICWITLQTNLGIYRREFHPGDEACAGFSLQENESIVAIFAYCNLHGLWMVLP